MMNVLLRTAEDATTLIAMLAAGRRVRRLRRELELRLETMGDRLLEDMGLSRDQIAEIARRAYPEPTRETNSQAVYERLMALDDRQLEDIGLTRAMIPLVATHGRPANRDVTVAAA